MLKRTWIRVLSLGAVVLATTSGCADSGNTAPSPAPTSTHPVESAYEMRGRSREIIAEMLALIPSELRASDVEEERNKTVVRSLSACVDAGEVDPSDWNGAYSYLGGLGVSVISEQAGREAIQQIYDDISKRTGWEVVEGLDHGQGRKWSLTSPDGFFVEAYVFVMKDGTNAVHLSAHSPCFLPAESPWPNHKKI
ncbi:hypothetical protein [Gulosibacter bifidus]|uniref:Lipoprotein n=1 Tax=Gulosibacter bifidus TaxID=272239 RepID=A0ABW5RIV2_9MICO|nr:hypothetical protein [Gulosibacter bifidus]